MKSNEYTVQGEAVRLDGISFLCREANQPIVIRDGRLITGQQQQSSSALTVELVLEPHDE